MKFIPDDMRERRLPIFVIVLVGILALVLFRLYCFGPKTKQTPKEPVSPTEVAESKSKTKAGRGEKKGANPAANRTEGADRIEFNRGIKNLVYTRHAKCRMDCREIDESEVMEIRDEGKINYAKSELNSKRDPKFALEGITHDQQHVRIIFAQTAKSLVVVTCIDLETDFACNCN